MLTNSLGKLIIHLFFVEVRERLRGGTLEILHHVLEHAVIDCGKMLPFLFVAFLLIEGLEKLSETMNGNLMERVGRTGPFVGAVLGCVPQCGFSVMASNLYSTGMISVGTLLAVFLATSDEAVLIMVSQPQYAGEILKLLIVKVVIAVTAGYLIDLFLGKRITEKKCMEEICHDCGCHESHGILKPALKHTVKIFLYILLFTIVLNLIIEWIGIEQMSRYLLGDTLVQPIAAACIGLIPNCASSVVLTQLYLTGVIGFPSVVAGLCSSAGIALVILFKMNQHRKENLKILGLLWAVSAGAGMMLQIFM